MARRSTLLVVALSLLLAAPGDTQTSTGTEYALFWRGDLRVLATRDRTMVTLIDVETGLDLVGSWTANIPGNPIRLDAGEVYEANSGSVTYHIRINSAPNGGPAETKPIVVWTGALETGLKHPAAPPVASNAWGSYIPALAPGSVENGAEVGREHYGFVSEEMYVFARKGPTPTSIVVTDLANNVDFDNDDNFLLGPSSPELMLADSDFEVYYLRGFEDDTIHVQSNVDVSLLVGAGITGSQDWTATPPSYGAGEDFRELGTLFIAFVSRDLTIFPTQDDTTVTITDLSDGDDSLTLTLAEGDLVGDYELFTTDLFARVGTGITPRAAAPAVTLRTLGASAPFDDDIVRIEADRPILVYLGPKSSDTFEFADVDYSIQTGPDSYVLYGYAQNGGAADFQVFSFSNTTTIKITSLSYTTGFQTQTHHDVLIPTTPYLGGNTITNDWYWSSTNWDGELLRIETDGPVSIINGDYDAPNFGCFIPFVASSGELLPIADAGPNQGSCPGELTFSFDGSASFDTDSTLGSNTPTWSWDTDDTVDLDGDGDFTNDDELQGAVVSYTFPQPGNYMVTLTYTDDDGQSDTDTLLVRAGLQDTGPPQLSCPASLSADAGLQGDAWVDVLAQASDDCLLPPTVVNDRTPNGADASDDYPCGVTEVVFTATDSVGNSSQCTTLVEVVPPGPPPRLSDPLRGVKFELDHIRWSWSLPDDPAAPAARLYASPVKDVAPAQRSLLLDSSWHSTTWTETDVVRTPPQHRYYQLVVVSCDGLMEGPY